MKGINASATINYFKRCLFFTLVMSARSSASDCFEAAAADTAIEEVSALRPTILVVSESCLA